MKTKVIAKAMPEADSLTLDRDHYYRQVLYGYYDFDCMVGEGTVRKAKFYIPENSVYNQPTVFLMIPGNWDPYEFLEESGWKEQADETGLYIVLMEPEADGNWGDKETETVYINKLRESVGCRPLFCPFTSNFYAAAYGEAADLLAYQSLWNPKSWAAVCLAGTKGLDLQEEQRLCGTESPVESVMMNEIQMPVWVVSGNQSESVKRLITYYNNANHSGKGRMTEYADMEYLPAAGGTLDEHWCAKVLVSWKDWTECMGREFCNAVYEHLFRGLWRYAGNKNGALRYNEAISRRGFKKFSANVRGGYYEDGSDYYNRVWWVYVPESVDRTKPSPAVFLFHGAGGSGDEIGDRSGWAKVAEENGIILICPSASNENLARKNGSVMTNTMFRSRWNTAEPKEEFPSDMVFLDYLYEWLTGNYNVDISRIYASGQSSGGMMTWGCAAYRPDYFAAVAPVSAKNINKVSEPLPPVKGSAVPIMANLGMEDPIFPGGFATDEARELIDYWCEYYGLDKNWSSYTFMGDGEGCSYEDGLFINYLFRTEDGVPLLRLVETRTKTHAIWPSECKMIWDEWFTKFKKDGDTKTLYYEGKKVEIAGRAD